MNGISLDKNLLRRATDSIHLIAPFFRKYALRISLGFFSLFIVNILQLLIPRIIKKAVDSLQLGTATQAGLLRYGAITVGLALGIALFRFGWRYLIIGFSRLLEKDLRNGILAHLLTLDRTFFQRKTTGELMALSTNDLASVQLACGMGLIAFADAAFMTLATLTFMAYIHPGLTLIVVVPMPLLALITNLLAARLHRRFRKVQEQFSSITEFARSSLNSIRLIKAYTQERDQTARFDSLGRTYVRDNLKLAMVQGALFPFSGFIANICLLMVVFFGGRLAINSVITIGDLVAFISYLFMLTWPMMALGWVVNLIQRGITSLERMQEVFQARPSLADPADPLPKPQKVREISIKKLRFSYNDQTKSVLNNVSVTIRPGILGIVGRTGSGKSTLCNLLARLYPVEDNSILLDGIDVNRLKLSAVRSLIAYVPQDVVLFADTIAANISMGTENATQDQIENAAKAAVMHEEIISMPEGYQTRIGERGVRLSGGQKQRIAIARALLLERPIILIDDGLSAVDMQIEHAIIRSIAGYLHGKICIIASHRVAPLADAGKILVMEKGKIIASGTHEQLMGTNSFYTNIYRFQTSTADSGGNLR